MILATMHSKACGLEEDNWQKIIFISTGHTVHFNRGMSFITWAST